MSWIRATIEFIYDFLADDGWEVLVGLALFLPLTYLVSQGSELLAGSVLIAGVLVTMAVSLTRQLPQLR